MSSRQVRVGAILIALAALLLMLASATLIDRRSPGVERVSISRTTESGLALTHAALDIEFSEPVVQRTAEVRLRISPAVDGSLSWDGERTLIFTPNDRFPLATEFRVWLERGFADRAGNVAERASDPFIFHTVDLPALASSDPADEGRDIPVDATVSLTFDRLMDTQRTAAAVRLDPARPLVTAWRGTTLLISPQGGLAPGTRYRLTVEGSAADGDGNELGRPIVIDFATLAAGLEATALIPADGSAGVSPSGPIAIRFDRPIETDAAAGAVRLTPEVSGRVSLEAPVVDVGGVGPGAPTLLVFRPDAPLAPSTTYTVALQAGVVHALGGGETAAARSWSFTTGSGLEPPQNQILFLSSRAGPRNVWAMNPDGTNARQLTAELGPVTSYDVTADGGRLVFAAGGVVASLSLPDGRRTVLTGPDVAEYAPRLLPDGTQVVVGRRERATGRDLGSWLVAIDGGGSARQLLPDGAPPLGSTASSGLPDPDGREAPWSLLPAVSADGELALLTGADTELRQVRLDDAAATLTGLLEPAGRPVWLASAGGFLVPARRERDGATGTWLIPRHGSISAGPPVRDAIGAGRGGIVGLDAPAGRHVTYLAGLGSEPTVLTSDELLDRQPSLSPGGDEVVFARVSVERPEVSAGIWAVAIEGGDPRQLSADGSDPRWLP
ncbi:MAG TPA: Ig-like domain-containing protein [Candidatus Limnocylindrales bacterium]|nr:Ig-like domain-containing protein [Candidatus Limnocylindrales bacterium]